mmetsp:Transcript_52981/g.164571  ORF Transcript_52981/g.164571 Transcript_52981/m.164571 type:complete len:228 (+) Transcript_52981:354-1037(+)
MKEKRPQFTLVELDECLPDLLNGSYVLVGGVAVVNRKRFNPGRPSGLRRPAPRRALEEPQEVLAGGPPAVLPAEPRGPEPQEVLRESPRDDPLILLLHVDKGVNDDREEEVQKSEPNHQHECHGKQPVHHRHRAVKLQDPVSLNERPKCYPHLGLDGLWEGSKDPYIGAQHPVCHEGQHEEKDAKERHKVQDVVCRIVHCAREDCHSGVRTEVEYKLYELDVTDQEG